MDDPRTTTFHRHWRGVPDATWRWPNFSPAEIGCRGRGKLLNNAPALDKLQALRDRLGKPLIVRSAYRGPDAAYQEFFRMDPPARSTADSRLMIDIAVEIEAIAYNPA